MPAFGAAQPLRHETPRDRAATGADLLGSASGAARFRRRLRAEAVRRRAAPQAGLNRPDLGRHDDGKSVAALSSSFERAVADRAVRRLGADHPAAVAIRPVDFAAEVLAVPAASPAATPRRRGPPVPH